MYAKKKKKIYNMNIWYNNKPPQSNDKEIDPGFCSMLPKLSSSPKSQGIICR